MVFNTRHWNWAIGISGIAIAAAATPAAAQQGAHRIDIPAQSLADSLRQLARQTGANILFRPESMRGRAAPAVSGTLTAKEAAQRLLVNSGLSVRIDSTGALIISMGKETGTDSARDEQTADATDTADIVVTATKRSERANDVPQSISVRTGEQFRRAQDVRFTDYLNKVPGVDIVSFAQGNTQIIFRGLTTGAGQLSSTVATYVDEVPYGSSTIFTTGATNTPDFDPRDLDRVEVLRGPQGTLYGADSLGGVLKYVTTPPNLSRMEGRIQAGIVGVADGGTGYDVSGMLNVPIVSDKLALRITGYSRLDPGYIDDVRRGLHDINESDVYGGRATLLWKPSSGLQVRLSAVVQNLKTRNLATEDVDYYALKPIYGDLRQQRFINSPIDSRYRLYSGTVNWDLGWADLISATSYSTLDSVNLGDLSYTYGAAFSAAFGVPLGAALEQRIHQNKFTQEIRLQSPSGRSLEWRAGLYYTREYARTEQRLLPFDPATGGYYNPLTGKTGPTEDIFFYRGPSHYTEIAGFGDLTYHFTQSFDVTVGGRYSKNNQRFHEIQAGFLLGGASIDFRNRSADDSWTYLINPRLRLAPNMIAYSRISTGYRPGGPNIGLPAASKPPTFGPDTVTSYEIGTKGDLLARRLSFDVAAFRIDWKDIQVTQQLNGFIYVVNGPKARSQGVEATFSLRPTKGLNVSLSGTYTDAELRQDAPTSIGGFAGERLPNVSRWAGNADVGYEWTLGTLNAFVGANYHYQGDRKAEFVPTPAGPVTNRATLPSYNILDLRAGVTKGGWSLNLFAKERAVLGIAPLANAPSPAAIGLIPYAAGILQPRTIGASISASF
jgi:iron complex outermembrane recepter protein